MNSHIDSRDGRLTWVGPLHAIGMFFSGLKIVPSPARVADDDMR